MNIEAYKARMDKMVEEKIKNCFGNRARLTSLLNEQNEELTSHFESLIPLNEELERILSQQRITENPYEITSLKEQESKQRTAIALRQNGIEFFHKSLIKRIEEELKKKNGGF